MSKGVTCKTFDYYLALCSNDCLKSQASKDSIIQILQRQGEWPYEILYADYEFFLMKFKDYFEEYQNFCIYREDIKNIINTFNFTGIYEKNDAPKLISLYHILEIFDLKIVPK
jgi:hypothetical protein